MSAGRPFRPAATIPVKADLHSSDSSLASQPAPAGGGAGEVRTEFFSSSKPFPLRCGDVLDGFTLAYETYGTLAPDASNAILVFHAMTGSQHAAGFNPEVPGLEGRWVEALHEGWWEGFIGPGKAIDTRKYFVVCANYLGGCYGSTGPASPRSPGGPKWGAEFPPVRISDIVDSQIRLLDDLGIGSLHAVIGASIGGFLALSLATRYPDRVRTVIPIATGLGTTMIQRLMNFEQIAAIELDPDFRAGHYEQQPKHGLAAARRTAHKTFVSLQHMSERARDEVCVVEPPFGWYRINHPVESYMLHVGEHFATRFDANSYLRIIDAWQWFDLLAEAGAENYRELFSRCRAQKYLVFSIDSDGSFEPSEQSLLVGQLEKSKIPVTWISVHSAKGHDAFLLEPALFAPHITHALS